MTFSLSNSNTCPDCDETMPRGWSRCPSCGYRFCVNCADAGVAKRAESVWSPPELGGMTITVCDVHHAEYARERSDWLRGKVSARAQAQQAEVKP